jgi:hypothetical protein
VAEWFKAPVLKADRQCIGLSRAMPPNPMPPRISGTFFNTSYRSFPLHSFLSGAKSGANAGRPATLVSRRTLHVQTIHGVDRRLGPLLRRLLEQCLEPSRPDAGPAAEFFTNLFS